MKALTGNARNLILAEAPEGKLIALIEVVLIVSEPKFKVSLDGFDREREVEDFRFTASAEGLRNLSKSLLEMVDDAEALEERATLMTNVRLRGAP